MKNRPDPHDSLHVFLDSELTAGPTLIGTLFSRDAQVWFTYEREWLKNPAAFELDPDLQLGEGSFFPDPKQSNFGVFLDSSPDRWGQMLMDRREQLVAKAEGRKARALHAWDYLIGVQDLTRMGALRFRRPGSDQFLDHHPLPAPPVTELRTLEAIASQVASREAPQDLDRLRKWLSVLVAPGASLGGARPKANYRDTDGALWIAKFPSRDDQRDYGAWEKLLRDMSREAGIWAPESTLRKFPSPYHTFCVKRFDRSGERRHFFISAMTALNKHDGTEGSYVDLLEFIQERGAAASLQRDREQLFRRLVYNVAAGNRDDHLRNHGFLYTREGWRLAPAYDMNPCFDQDHHVLKLDGSVTEPSLEAALATAELYELTNAAAAAIVEQTCAVVKGWKDRARKMGIARGDIELTEAAFVAIAGMD